MIGNPYFQWMHLSNCTNLSKSHIEQVMHLNVKNKKRKKKEKKKTTQLNALLMLIVLSIYKWALSFLFVFLIFNFFFGKNLRQVFSVDYIWVLPHTFIESNLKWIKKKHITVSQIYFANMGYYFIESRGKKKSQYLDVIYEKLKNEATYLWVTSRHFVF